MQQSFIPINKLSEEPYSFVLGYPKATKRQLSARINELGKLGITSVSFQGDLLLGKLRVLGKGYVGIVVLAKKNQKKVAVKIRRVDSQRTEMRNEGKLLKIANKVGVGPKFIDSSKNFLVMEYLDGQKIFDWVNGIKEKNSIIQLKLVIKKTFEACYKLDQIGLDHGELSNISKHVIVKKNKVTVVDFESSSTTRKVSNVTSATQGIFIGSGISKIIQKIYKIPSKTKIINALRRYKKLQNHESFENVLAVLKL